MVLSLDREKWLPVLARDEEAWKVTEEGAGGGTRTLRYSVQGDWTAEDADAILAFLRGRNDLTETIDPETLEISVDDVESEGAEGATFWTVKVTGVPAITEYCYNDAIRAVPHTWTQTTDHRRQIVPEYSELGVQVESRVYESRPLDIQNEEATLDAWETGLKYYTLVKRFRYAASAGAAVAGATYVVEMRRTAPEASEAMKVSGVTGAPMHYRFYVEPAAPSEASAAERAPVAVAARQLAMFQPALSLISTVLRSGLLLTEAQRADVLHGYSLLIAKVFKEKKRDRRGPRGEAPPVIGAARAETPALFLAPKPLTLERIHLLDPDRHEGIISVVKNYAVTDKADGERMLMYIHTDGEAYMINNTFEVRPTGHRVKTERLHGTLIDGEYIPSRLRRETGAGAAIARAGMDLFAAFDIYFLGGKSVMDLPLIRPTSGTLAAATGSGSPGAAGAGASRYTVLQGAMAEGMWAGGAIGEGSAAMSSGSAAAGIHFSYKIHVAADGAEMFAVCRSLLEASHEKPYEMDGLVFTPAYLSVFGYYPGRPVEVSWNMRWSRVLKWKPPQQNTIDFRVSYGREVTERLTGQRFRELRLFTGYNALQWEPITVDQGLKLRFNYEYGREFRRQLRTQGGSYDFQEFAPISDAVPGVSVAWVPLPQGATGAAPRAENGDPIPDDSIVEFTYHPDRTALPVGKRWEALRVREDKTRLLRLGEKSKTANDFAVATSIWRTIHRPVTTEMIVGAVPVVGAEAPEDAEEKLLSTDQIYYLRDIHARHMLSSAMLSFHTNGIKAPLYAKSQRRGALLELACGMAGDLPRWRGAAYRFVLGVDSVRDNIMNPRNGSYAQMLRQMDTLREAGAGAGAGGDESGQAAPIRTDYVFVVGDCGYTLADGSAADTLDEDSKKALRLLFDRSGRAPMNAPWLKFIAGRAARGFDVASCMFALHYFCESEETLNGFLYNVGSNLRKGGLFIATFMDGRKVHSLLADKRIGQRAEGRKTPAAEWLPEVTVPVWAIVKNYDTFNGTIAEGLGKQVGVYLEVTQRIIPEYLVHMDVLTEVAARHGLVLSEYGAFGDRFQELLVEAEGRAGAGGSGSGGRGAAARDTSRLDEAVLTMRDDEIQKQFSFLNCWVVFRKV